MSIAKINFRISNGGGSLNLTTHTVGQALGGTNPQVPDLVNGGFLVDFEGSTTHDQVYGPTEVWTKMAFYVKMNSAPGVSDGIFRQWINDQRIYNEEDIPWVKETVENNMVGWNYFCIGGNDHFQPFPNEDRFEDWWALDDLVVRDSIPEELL